MIIWELRNTVRGQTRDLPIDSLSLCMSLSLSLSLTIKVNLMPRVSRHGVVMTLTKGRIKFCISVPHGTVYYTATAWSAVFIAVIAVSSQVGKKNNRILQESECGPNPAERPKTPQAQSLSRSTEANAVTSSVPPSRSDVGETRVRKARRHRGGKRNGSAATELRSFSPAVSNRGTGEGDVDGRRDGGQHFISAYSLLTSSCRSINLHAGAASGHSLRTYLGTVSTGTS